MQSWGAAGLEAQVQLQVSLLRAMLGTSSPSTEPSPTRHQAGQTPAPNQAAAPQMVPLLGKRTGKQKLCPGEKQYSSAQGANPDLSSFPTRIKGGWKDLLPSKSCFLQPHAHPKYITEEVLKNNHHMKVFYVTCISLSVRLWKQARIVSPKRLLLSAEAKSELVFHEFSNRRFYE